MYSVIYFFFVFIQGIFWILTYLLIIKQGFKDKTYGMPIIAFCFNISWEFIFSFIYPHPIPGNLINIFWFLLDIIILFQILSFWKNEFPNLSIIYFYSLFISSLTLSYIIIYYISSKSIIIGSFVAYLQNLLMSILFIIMYFKRKSLRGQSIYIALFKMIGSIFACITGVMYIPKHLILLKYTIIIFIFILSFDLIYLILLYCKSLKLNNNQ